MTPENMSTWMRRLFMVYRYLNMKGDGQRLRASESFGDFDKLKKLGLKWCGEYKQQACIYMSA